MPRVNHWEWCLEVDSKNITKDHVHQAYRLNWSNLCKLDSCRKNCKKVLCLACFDKSWLDSSSSLDTFDSCSNDAKREDFKTFVGLKNLGATCYVNCLLQLWFHNPALRKAIYLWKSEQELTQHLTSTCSSPKRIKHESKSASQLVDSTNDCNIRLSNGLVEGIEGSAITITKSDVTNNNGNTATNSSTNVTTTSIEKSIITGSTNVTTTNATTSSSSPSSAPASASASTSLANSLNPMEQLQLIFARLQFTNRRTVDPSSFVSSLALNASEQQDAQEFGNLFMEFLEKQLINQPDPFVSKIIQNQYCGRYEYVTECDECHTESSTDANFYELDLSIQNLEKLYDCLNDYFKPVPLDGKYNCSHCRKPQNAHRKIILKKLPPTLNLQLLRFVYDIQKNARQKLNSYLQFPEVLDMRPYMPKSSNRNSCIYVLTNVLIHRGSSPHSGHYIAHIKDRVTKDWIKFNDESVERIGPQLQTTGDGESITVVDDSKNSSSNQKQSDQHDDIAPPRSPAFQNSPSDSNKTNGLRFNGSGGDQQRSGLRRDSSLRNSKVNQNSSSHAVSLLASAKNLKSRTAYMLVYQSLDNEALSYPSDSDESWILPEHLQATVLEENSKCDEWFESLRIAKELDEQSFTARRSQVRSIYDKLVVKSPNDEFEFINKSWLSKWISTSYGDARFPPIDNSNMRCPHDKFNFHSMDLVKCVRKEGADLLYKEMGGGPRYTQDDLCFKCVEIEVRRIQLKERLKEDQKIITSHAKFKFIPTADEESSSRAYVVGRDSYRDWQRMVIDDYDRENPAASVAGEPGGPSASDEDDNRSSDSIVECENGEPKSKREFNSDCLCEHKQLHPDTNLWRLVPPEVWAVFCKYFGERVPSNPGEAPKKIIEFTDMSPLCPECSLLKVEQQEHHEAKKSLAFEQKQKLLDLYHSRKRVSWDTMEPSIEYRALSRSFMTKWQKFIRNPTMQERPASIDNSEDLLCEHKRLLYCDSNCDPSSPDCPFVLVTRQEWDALKSFYSYDKEISFVKINETDGRTDPAPSSTKSVPSTTPTDSTTGQAPTKKNRDPEHPQQQTNRSPSQQQQQSQPQHQHENDTSNEENDMSVTSGTSCEIEWRHCIISEPNYCSECYDKMKESELRQQLDYDQATIYVVKVEYSPFIGPMKETPCDSPTNPIASTSSDCEILHDVRDTPNTGAADSTSTAAANSSLPSAKRRKKNNDYDEEGGNDFTPSSKSCQSIAAAQAGANLRRSYRRTRQKEHPFVIKPTMTLLTLKKEIFSRLQVLPMDQRLFMDQTLLSDNTKTMADLKMLPNTVLKLEVDKPLSGDPEDIIEEDISSRKSFTT
ncbi:Ubiquitin carboxyl-terminal hydrolase 48, partial [Fragariocoptes setiger]